MAFHPAENRSPVRSLDPEPELRLLLELQPRGQAFIENVACCLRRPRMVWTGSPPAEFWPDVFIASGSPWGRVAESLLLHTLTVVALITVTNAIGMLLPHQPMVRLQSQIYHYDISNYLPPLDTGSPPAPKPRQGQPLLAKQKIISLPPRPDNFEQTIISPAEVKLPTNLKLPNIVAWTETPGVPSAVVTRSVAQLAVSTLPTQVIPPAPDPLRREISQLRTPEAATKVIEPPPSPKDLNSTRKLEMTANIIEPPPEAKLNPRAIHAPPPSVIEPPPSANVARNIGNLNVGHLAATVAAPKIEVAEQKVITIQPGGADVSRSLGRNSRGTPPPAPAIMPVGGANAGPNTGQLIALNVHPAIPTGPISVPPGRRSGEFAVGPEGMPNAPATPDIKAGGSGAGGASEGNNRLPTGITIGNAPEAPPRGSVIVEGDPKTQPRDASRDKEMLMAAARPPRIGEIPRHTTTTPPPSGPKVAEDRVFGAKQIYTLALNTPNLSSTGGSWIIRFAQLEEDHIPLPLSAPVATRTVDPAYPAELMREGYEGTVILYAVIHKDGTVGEVRVLRGVEGRLDENARVALLRWKFRPGTKNGQAVDLEAVVQIPFKATRIPY